MKFKNTIMRIGRSMSAMVMPNIGAFIAWGLITALFIPDGWLPNDNLAKLVSPALTYLLPILIAYTAGKNIAGDRGGVTGAIATIGVIAGSDIPMFIGAMIMGPAGGLAIKEFDKLTKGRVRSGFEMLVNNFSVGIIGMLLAIAGFLVVGNAISSLTGLVSRAAEALIAHKMLPLISLVVEPAKILFLNNAINHGIFSPIGIEQVHEIGQSVMFLIEANPGAGLGMLLAYWAVGKGSSKTSAPGAAIIHFFGGIHEIYFPYVFANPLLLISMIAGSSASLLFFSIFGGGLVAPASPGSIISVLAMAPKGQTLIVLAGVLIAAGVSFAVSLPLIKGRKANATDNQVNADVNISGSGTRQRIKFACDAGMGSSALGATRFRKRAAYENIDADISNCAIEDIPADTDIVVCQNHLKDRALEKVEKNSAEGGKKTVVIGIENFMDDPALDRLLESLKGGNHEVLAKDNILIGLKTESKDDAILRAGHLLEQKGYVQKGYAEAMLKRENESTTYMGMGIAIPHGTDEAKKDIIRSGIVILQYPEGVDFGNEKAYLIAGIAGKGDEHIEILASLGETFEDEDKLKTLMSAEDPNIIYNILNNNE
jgi:PTS system mannitol-specific IIC component